MSVGYESRNVVVQKVLNSRLSQEMDNSSPTCSHSPNNTKNWLTRNF